MGRLYIAQVLMSLPSTKRAGVPEVELKPMTPDAWAAWARDWDERQVLHAAEDGAPAASPLPSGLRPATDQG